MDRSLNASVPMSPDRGPARCRRAAYSAGGCGPRTKWSPIVVLGLLCTSASTRGSVSSTAPRAVDELHRPARGCRAGRPYRRHPRGRGVVAAGVQARQATGLAAQRQPVRADGGGDRRHLLPGRWHQPARRLPHPRRAGHRPRAAAGARQHRHGPGERRRAGRGDRAVRRGAVPRGARRHPAQRRDRVRRLRAVRLAARRAVVVGASRTAVRRPGARAAVRRSLGVRPVRRAARRA